MTRLTLGAHLDPRPDAALKLAPGMRYLTDLRPPDLLQGVILRSPHAHARILKLDCTAAMAMSGVVAVVTHEDVAPGFRLGLSHKDQPPIAVDRVRYIGEPIAAVAAKTREIARAAMAAIEVVFDLLPVVEDPQSALVATSPQLHDGGNLCHRTFHEHGDIRAGFAMAKHVVEDTYVTPRQVHAALELEGGVAIPTTDGRITIHAPAQHPHGVRDVIAGILGWSSDRVEIVGSPIGGGFGGKEDLHVQPITALLARATGKPVHVALSRPESMAAGVKRHPFRIRIRTACNEAGELLAHEVQAIADTGAYATHGPEVLDTAHENAMGPYHFPSARIEGLLSYTNNGVSGAFRGFGAVQMQIAVELQMERLARLTGMDPMQFRSLNLRDPDAKGPLGQTVLPQPELKIVADRLARHPMRSHIGITPGRWMHGTGSSLVSKGEGFGGGRPKLGGESDTGISGPNASAGVLAFVGGRIEYRSGLAEMGQGVIGALAAALSRELGVGTGDIFVTAGQTHATPDAGPTSASRGTQVAIRIARIGAPQLATQILQRASEQLGHPVSALALGPGGVYASHEPRNAPVLEFTAITGADILVEVAMPPIETADGSGASHKIFTTCGAIARVAVDRATGRIKAEQIVVLPACGPVLVPDAYLGQVEGGAIMASGLVLMEDLAVRNGGFLASNLDRYFIPTIVDAATVDVEPIEFLSPDDPVGIRGIGEIPLNAVAPAIAAAVFDAIGEAPTTFPVSPDWVLEVLARRDERGFRS